MSDAIKALDQQGFQQEVLQAEQPVLVDFYADWCGPCQAIKPVLEELAQDYQGQVAVRKVDVDENPALAQQYSVRGIPTLLLFKAGQVQDTVVGVKSKSQLEAVLKQAI